MDGRSYLQRDNLGRLLAEVAPEDVLPKPRPATVRWGGQPHEGRVHARRRDPWHGGWAGLATWEREVTDGWWHAAAAWVPAHRITVAPVDQAPLPRPRP